MHLIMTTSIERCCAAHYLECTNQEIYLHILYDMDLPKFTVLQIKISVYWFCYNYIFFIQIYEHWQNWTKQKRQFFVFKVFWVFLIYFLNYFFIFLLVFMFLYLYKLNFEPSHTYLIKRSLLGEI